MSNLGIHLTIHCKIRKTFSVLDLLQVVGNKKGSAMLVVFWLVWHGLYFPRKQKSYSGSRVPVWCLLSHDVYGHMRNWYFSFCVWETLDLSSTEWKHVQLLSFVDILQMRLHGGVAGCRTWSDHVRKANQPNETAIAHAVSYTTSIFLRLHTTLTVLRLSSQQVLIKSFVVRCQQTKRKPTNGMRWVRLYVSSFVSYTRTPNFTLCCKSTT